MFGNDRAWIQAAIHAARHKFAAWPIDAKLIEFKAGLGYGQTEVVPPPPIVRKERAPQKKHYPQLEGGIFSDWK